MVSLYKSQVSAFAKDSETAVLWMISLRSKRFLSNCLHEKKKKRSWHTFEEGYFANIKINKQSTREKDDMVVLDKRIKRFNVVVYKYECDVAPRPAPPTRTKLDVEDEGSCTDGFSIVVPAIHMLTKITEYPRVVSVDVDAWTDCWRDGNCTS